MHIFIDTNYLFKKNILTKGFSDQIELIKATKAAQIYLVDIVLKEHKYRYLSRVKSKTSSNNEYFNRIEKELLCDLSFKIDQPQIEDKYDLRIKDILSANNIKVINSKRFLYKSDLFDMIDLSINKSPPFEKDGKGFKDASIFLSAYNYCISKKIDKFILISEDTDFVNIRLPEDKVDFEVIKDFIELYSGEEATLSSELLSNIMFDLDTNIDEFVTEEFLISKTKEELKTYYEYLSNIEFDFKINKSKLTDLKYLTTNDGYIYFSSLLLVEASGIILELDSSGVPDPWGPLLFRSFLRFTIKVEYDSNQKTQNINNVKFIYEDMYDLDIFEGL